MISPHRFLSAEADYPGVATVPLVLTFPRPVTWGHWATWSRKMVELEDEDETLRFYHAALAIATIEALPLDEAEVGEDDPAYSIDDLDPHDPNLPMAFVAWVLECAEQAMGNQIIVGGMQELKLRREMLPKDPATFNTADFTRLLPDLADYPGSVTFTDPFTAGAYREWQKAIQLRTKFAPNDPANGIMARQFRGALGLVKEWDIEGADWGTVRRRPIEEVPLVLVSFLVEAGDIFITRRMNRKKVRRLFETT